MHLNVATHVLCSLTGIVFNLEIAYYTLQIGIVYLAWRVVGGHQGSADHLLCYIHTEAAGYIMAGLGGFKGVSAASDTRYGE